jgi:hypothetical protein
MTCPRDRCCCMLEDNLGCPEMSHCYDYHVWKDPNFKRSLETLDPLVHDMIQMRVIDYSDRVERLVIKAYAEFYPPLFPIQTKYYPEIKRLMDIIDHDLKTLHKDYHTHIMRSIFDV